MQEQHPRPKLDTENREQERKIFLSALEHLKINSTTTPDAKDMEGLTRNIAVYLRRSDLNSKIIQKQFAEFSYRYLKYLCLKGSDNYPYYTDIQFKNLNLSLENGFKVSLKKEAKEPVVIPNNHYIYKEVFSSENVFPFVKFLFHTLRHSQFADPACEGVLRVLGDLKSFIRQSVSLHTEVADGIKRILAEVEHEIGRELPNTGPIIRSRKQIRANRVYDLEGISTSKLRKSEIKVIPGYLRGVIHYPENSTDAQKAALAFDTSIQLFKKMAKEAGFSLPRYESFVAEEGFTDHFYTLVETIPGKDVGQFKYDQAIPKEKREEVLDTFYSKHLEVAHATALNPNRPIYYDFLDSQFMVKYPTSPEEDFSIYIVDLDTTFEQSTSPFEHQNETCNLYVFRMFSEIPNKKTYTKTIAGLEKFMELPKLGRSVKAHIQEKIDLMKNGSEEEEE